MTTSSQTKHAWKRLCSWYGADVVERKYGPQAPEDWAKAIDAIDRSRLDVVLSEVRSKHPIWPPSLHEFEEIAKPKPVGPNPVDLLDARLKEVGLTYAQHRGIVWLSKQGAVTGVEIPTADGSGTYRVMLQDVMTPQKQATACGTTTRACTTGAA